MLLQYWRAVLFVVAMTFLHLGTDRTMARAVYDSFWIAVLLVAFRWER